MTTVKKDSFSGGSGHTESDDAPLGETTTDIADDLAAIVARSDLTVQQKLDEIATQLTALRVGHDSLVTNFSGHQDAAGVHYAADVDNVITSPVATDVTADILVQVNDAYDMLVAHMAEGAAVHPGGADTNNVITATYPATNEAEAVALHNDIYAQYTAHIGNTGGAWHTNTDVTNTYTEGAASDWDDLITTMAGYKNTTGFNAHVQLTAGPTHGADDVAHIISSPDCGVQKTALELEINEFKADLNAHIEHDGVHPNEGVVNATAAATTEATSVGLINGLTTTGNAHYASADDHLDADTEVVVGVATEYEDILPVVAEWKAAFQASSAKSAVHNKADSGNTETVIGAGGDVAVLGAGGAVVLKTINGDL